MTASLFVTFAGLAGILMTRGLLSATPFTVPVLALALGAGLHVFDLLPGGEEQMVLSLIAEGALALLLFADATGLRRVRAGRAADWAGRMLLAGLPLAMVIGAAMVWAVFAGHLTMWESVLIGALLVPTDAGLGQAIFDNEAVPEDTRHALLAESGLNDGLALPAILFAACAVVGFDHVASDRNWLLFGAMQVGFGVLAGAAMGALGGKIVRLGQDRWKMSAGSCALFSLVLVGLIFVGAEAVGGNAFLAVFTGGLVFGRMAGDAARAPHDFLEEEGEIVLMLAFVFVGAVILPLGLPNATVQTVAVVALSLFVVRPVAVWISLSGAGVAPRQRLLMGWFGPRGLATALFSVVLLEEVGAFDAEAEMFAVVALAVLSSALLHGASAARIDLLLGRSGPS